MKARESLRSADKLNTTCKLNRDWQSERHGLDFFRAVALAVGVLAVKRLLQKRGHRVVVVASGYEALEAFKNENYDLVLMDMLMPEMGGIEATAAIRAGEKGSAFHRPVIALTADAMKGTRERCLAAGMDGYLSKPIRLQELDELREL
jgi:two-component system sensor histidine kinase/response regulator